MCVTIAILTGEYLGHGSILEPRTWDDWGKNENAKKPEKFSFYSSEENISNTAHFGSSSEQFSFKWSDFSSDWPEM